MLGKKSHTGLHPFLEALVHLERQGVLHGEVVSTVGSRVAVGEEVGEKVVQLLARGKIAVVAFGTQRVNERSHGHKAPHEGGILRQCLQLLERRTVCVGFPRPGLHSSVHLSAGGVQILDIPCRKAVCEEGTVDAYRVAYAFQAYGHVGSAVACGEEIRIGDVAFVLQSAVLHVLDVARFVISVCLVLISAVIPVDRSVDGRVVLVLIVPTCISIVNIEPNARALVDVGRESRHEMVVSVGFAARGMVVQPRHRRFGVGEDEAVGGDEEPIVGAFEHKLRSHHEVAASIVDTRGARCAEAPGEVVFSVESVGIIDILEQVAQRVRTLWAYATETLVECPGKIALRHRIGVDRIFF